WAGKWNDTVDHIAKQVIQHDHKGLLAKLTKLANDADHQVQKLHGFHKFWVAATAKAMAKSADRHKLMPQSIPNFDDYFSQRAWNFPFKHLGDNIGADAPFGYEFTVRFLRWFQQVGFIAVVPTEQMSSLLALYVAFALSTRTMTPAYVRAF
ncbi:unnamed protein product, partial [Durusdinium trenchii]